MNKAEFKQYCKTKNLQTAYSGRIRTFYISGQNADKILKHFVSTRFDVVTANLVTENF